MKSKKTHIKTPSRLNYRAWVTITYYNLIPRGAPLYGSDWESKTMMCEVIQLNLSKGTMRVRYFYEEGNPMGRVGTQDMSIQNLMQSTGRLDKNGVEIFDKDICDTNMFQGLNVVWSGECWKLKGFEDHMMRFTECGSIEVKSNEFEKVIS